MRIDLFSNDILSPKHTTGYILGTWGLMHIGSIQGILMYKQDYPKGINRSIGATQAKSNLFLLQVPVHIHIDEPTLGGY